MGRRAWTKVIVQNRQTIYELAKEAVVTWLAGRRERKMKLSTPADSALSPEL
jgi:hypothetical protein